MLIAFDSNVLTAFLTANSRVVPSAGDDLAAFRLFIYAPKLVILPTVAVEAAKIPKGDKHNEHLNWIWYHFDEAPLGPEAQPIESRTQELLPHHPEKDADDCRIVAEAEAAGAALLATIDKKIKRLQPHTLVQLLTPADALGYLKIEHGAHPQREPADGHPLAGSTWWRI